MDWISLIGIVLGLGYLIIILFLVSHWRKQDKVIVPENFQPTTPLSILIAAKNEANNITALTKALLNQNYPSHLIEFFIINDHSNDNMEQVFLSQKLPANFILLQATGNPGKKHAITQGIAFAKNEYIVTTDADCEPSPDWLRSIAWLIKQKKPIFIAGPVNFHKSNSLLERFQALDFLGMMLITGVGISIHQFFMANGANMCFAKAAFLNVGGYEGNLDIPSGDDMFLISKLSQAYPKSQITFNKTQQGVVYTRPESTLTGFIRQRIRWGAKNKVSQDHTLQFILGWVFITATWIVATILTPYWWIMLLLKLIADYLLLFVASHFYNQPKLLKAFLPSFFMHTIYIAFIGVWSLFGHSKKWK